MAVFFMAGEVKRNNHSTAVVMFFILAFLLFAIFNKPSQDNNITGAAVGRASGTTIGVTLALIILIGVGGFFFMKYKLKHKAGIASGKKLNLSEDQIDSLFKDDKFQPEFNNKEQKMPEKNIIDSNNGPIEISSSNLSNMDVQKPEEPAKDFSKPKESSSQNELKSKLNSMLNKNVPPQKILDILMKQGYKRPVVDKAVDEINFERLALFISKAMSQNYSKEKIRKSLLKNGWSQQQIDKALQSPGRLKRENNHSLDLDLI